MQKQRVIVIGGGPAGLMAAGQAASLGAETILLEKMSRPARKLRITGKGRCNITNIAPVSDFIKHYGDNGKFLRQAFARFSNIDLIDFFNNAGLKTVTERGGRVFPESGDANDVAAAMIDWINAHGVTIKTNSPVKKILISNQKINGVICFNEHIKAKEQLYEADSVIVATGGASYPATGSTGDGYDLAESAGHLIIPVRPALVPLETAGNTARKLEGLSLKNVSASIWTNGKKCGEEFGDMLFTGTGISGPIILTLSKNCVDSLKRNNDVSISIDLKPALDHNILDKRLQKDIKESSKKTIKNMLKGLMPERLIEVCLENVKITPDKVVSQISAEERKRLRLWLKDFRLKVKGYGQFEEAIITAGGVDLRQIDPRTMESRITKGLYFAGEVLDIDGDTGGYNLQAAFSTGWLAGRSSAEKNL